MHLTFCRRTSTGTHSKSNRFSIFKKRKEKVNSENKRQSLARACPTGRCVAKRKIVSIVRRNVPWNRFSSADKNNWRNENWFNQVMSGVCARHAHIPHPRPDRNRLSWAAERGENSKLNQNSFLHCDINSITRSHARLFRAQTIAHSRWRLSAATERKKKKRTMNENSRVVAMRQ